MRSWRQTPSVRPAGMPSSLIAQKPKRAKATITKETPILQEFLRNSPRREVAEAGVEPAITGPSNQPLCLFAYPAGKLWVWESNPGVRAYETQLSSGPPTRVLAVAKGRFELPCPDWARRSERRVSASFTTWPMGNAGRRAVRTALEPTKSREGYVWPLRGPCTPRRLCLERDSNPHSLRFKLSRSAVWRTQADSPAKQAAAAGIEPASGRLTAGYPYQHGSRRISDGGSTKLKGAQGAPRPHVANSPLPHDAAASRQGPTPPPLGAAGAFSRNERPEVR